MSTRRVVRAISLQISTALMLSCASPTQLWLVIDSNVPTIRTDATGMRTVAIEVSVDGEASPFFSQTHDLQATFSLPGFKLITPPRANESRRARVRVVGTLADGTELRQTALAAFGSGRRLRLDLFLARECAGAAQMACEAMGQSCGAGGRCVPIERMELPEYEGVNATDASAMDATTLDVASADAPNGEASMPVGTCTGAMAVSGAAGIAAPRLVAPISGSVASSPRPMFQWALPAGVTGGRVEVCSDPACATVIATFESSGTSIQASCDLPRGTSFFRVRANNGGAYGADTSAVWLLRIGWDSGLGTATYDGIDGDFNGDGLADLVVASGAAVRLVTGVRGGAPVEVALAAVTATPQAMELVGDINGDGVSDLAVATSTNLQIVYGARAGMTAPAPSTIAPPMGTTTFGSGGTRTLTAAGDVDGDGYSDFAVGAPASNSNVGAAFIVFGDPATPVIAPLGTGPGLRSLELYGMTLAGALDTTGDGRPEVLVGAPGDLSNAGKISVWTFRGRTAMNVSNINGPALNARMGQFPLGFADFNADTRADFAAQVNPSDQFYLGTGGGTFGAPRAFVVGAGKLTAVLSSADGSAGSDLVFFRNTAPIGVYVWRGGSTFDSTMESAPVAAPMGLTFGDKTGSTGDFNGDGLADFVQGTTTAPLVFVPGAPRALGAAVAISTTRTTAVTALTYGN